MNTILIARHGNTFDPWQVAVRIGRRTDLSLSASGRDQAVNLGYFLHMNKISPAAVFTSNLKRTKQTAQIALSAAKLNLITQPLDIFDEIDYGPDEGKTYEEIVERVGAKALDDWESMALAPKDWIVDTDAIVANWQNFAKQMLEQYPDQTVMVVTSNGIARFAPYLTHDFFHFTEAHNIKLVTGAVGALSFHPDSNKWKFDYWNEKPQPAPEQFLSYWRDENKRDYL